MVPNPPDGRIRARRIMAGEITKFLPKNCPPSMLACYVGSYMNCPTPYTGCGAALECSHDVPHGRALGCVVRSGTLNRAELPWDPLTMSRRFDGRHHAGPGLGYAMPANRFVPLALSRRYLHKANAGQPSGKVTAKPAAVVHFRRPRRCARRRINKPIRSSPPHHWYILYGVWKAGIFACSCAMDMLNARNVI